MVQLAGQLGRRPDPQRPEHGDDRHVGPAGREDHAKLATSAAADPGLSNAEEDQGRLAFVAAFEVNYPFVYPSAQADVPKLAKVMGWAPYPRVAASMPASDEDGRIRADARRRIRTR